MALLAYALVADVQGDLPASLPAEIDSAFITKRILSATAIVDGSVGQQFNAAYNSGTQKFDSTNIPAIIEEITRDLAVSYCLRRLGGITRAGEAPTYAILQSKATRQLKDIKAGELQVIDPDGVTLGVSSDIYHNMTNVEPAIRKGSYDENGTLLDDTAGSLDAFNNW